MFHKIQLRLTLFAGAITTFILLAVTFGYLYISEKNLMENRMRSYQNDLYTLSSNMEQQSVITHNWLSSLEDNGSYYISLMDNGSPFLFNNISSYRSSAVNEAWNYYNDRCVTFEEFTLSYKSHYKHFYFTDSAHNDYFAFVICTENDSSVLEMLLLSPIAGLKSQISKQRFTYLAIVAAALIVLYIFSWFFVGKLLYPIEESRKKQNEFIAAASHELRTPLAVILSGIENMQENDAAKSFSQTLSVLHDESVRMSKLLEDLLTLSSKSGSFLSLSKSDVEPDTLLLDAYEAFEIMAKSKHLQLLVCLPDYSIPVAKWDKSRMEQVLAILIHNAISYTPEGGAVSISIAMQKEAHRKESYCLRISDTGYGIPDNEKSKIFDRFYRSEASRSGKGHFGLGLSIAAEIVNAHHGNISVSDNEGGGAVFTVVIPRYFQQP